ncbi:cyclic pyranopterin monophosphate synthase MoaC [Helicobacter sp. MIT 14-3879]|uniref:cyclic pyranopterin monophosphate synthase MoaC n=1 Tax=Helicobacter sp. MIT 14-3879 TaxID=2040649 RepID=UPI000E1E2BE8|nr:cyclic pyranopterin monophosphate synthase MoaC [Helicobacter sp. MIT 14-3879]RDU61428.1 hypothetical protein CQA44_08955 [Helicobacter sp. MIT 14-3879]
METQNPKPKNIGLDDISHKGTNQTEVVSSGIIILNHENFFSIFDNKAQKDSLFQTAIVAGIIAAKKTSDVFPLCYHIPLTAIDIVIDMINKDSVIIEPSSRLESAHHGVSPHQVNQNFISPHLELPRHFKSVKSAKNIQSSSQAQTNSKLQSQITKINKAKHHFALLQTHEINAIKKQHIQAHDSHLYALCVKASIKAQGKVKPVMESLYATSTTLLSLYNGLKPLVKQNNTMTITQIHLESLSQH